MKAFDVGALAATDRGQLQRAARELGHGLFTRPPAEIARIRRELGELAEQATTERARGFLDAIAGTWLIEGRWPLFSSEDCALCKRGVPLTPSIELG